MADRKLLAVIKREYMERVRTRWFIIATVFGPVFFGALMLLPPLIASREKGGNDATNIIILDASGSGLGNRISSALAGGVTAGDHAPHVQTIARGELAAAESLATKEVMSERAKGYLVIDSASVTNGRARYAGSNTTALFDMQRLERALQRELIVLRVEQAGVDPELGRSLTSINASVSTERLTKQGRGGSGMTNFFVGLAVALVLYMTIFIYGLNVLRGVLEEKQTRVAEVVVASIPATRLLAGKVIGVGAVGLTQIVLWIIMGVVMYQVRTPILTALGAASTPVTIPDVGVITALTLTAFFVLGFMFYAGLFAAVGATINTEQEAQQAQMPIVLLLVSSVMFVQTILMQPESVLARTMSLLPFSAPIVMPLRMTVIPVPASEILMSLTSVAIGAVFTTWLAGRIYRVGLLMYGKRPTLKEMLNWVNRK